MTELVGSLSLYPLNKDSKFPELTNCIERIRVTIPISIPQELELKFWDRCKKCPNLSIYDVFIEEFFDVKSLINKWCKDHNIRYTTEDNFKYLYDGRFLRVDL